MRLDDSEQIEIAAPVEACFGVLTDYERYGVWFGCERAEVLRRDPDTVALTYDLLGRRLDVIVAFEADPPSRLVAEVVEAHRRLKDMDARWELEPLAETRTLARYLLSVELDVPLIVQGIARSRGRELMLTEPLRGLKEQAEGQRA